MPPDEVKAHRTMLREDISRQEKRKEGKERKEARNKRREEHEEEVMRPPKEARGLSMPEVEWGEFKDEEGGDHGGT